MNRLWIAFRLWLLDVDIDAGERAFDALLDDLPKLRDERAALEQQLYALTKDRPA